MPALCILAKMDMQTANSALFGAWLSSTANSGLVVYGVEVGLDIVLFALLFGRMPLLYVDVKEARL